MNTAAAYNVQDRLTRYGDFSFVYNANGDLLRKTKISTGEITRYVYDTMGNLASVTLPGGRVIEYLMDPLNRRVAKKVNGVTTRSWIYLDQLRPIAEFDENNSISSVYVYSTKSNVPDQIIKGTDRFRIISDHLGSPRLVVNARTGAIVQTMRHDEFGKVLSDSNPAYQPFGFAGGLYDPNTKLVRFGARDYDPETGRWTSKDPILFGGGDANLYGYVLNDPVNLVDPNGLWSFTVGGYSPGTGLGGGVTFGQNPNGSFFGGVWGGAGFGGGLSFNPDGTSPGYSPNECRNGPSIEIGGYTNAGGYAGPYSLGLESSGGITIGGRHPGYFNPPGPTGGGSNTRGLGFGGGFGLQVIGVW